MSFSCEVPPTFEHNYRELYDFFESAYLKPIRGIDECLSPQAQRLHWQKHCDGGGAFEKVTLTLFQSPLVRLSVHEGGAMELELTVSPGEEWSKVSESEEAELIGRSYSNGDSSLLIKYTAMSSRRVFLTFIKNDLDEIKQMEALLYRINIGTPTLEKKFSCYEDVL